MRSWLVLGSTSLTTKYLEKCFCSTVSSPIGLSAVFSGTPWLLVSAIWPFNIAACVTRELQNQFCYKLSMHQLQNDVYIFLSVNVVPIIKKLDKFLQKALTFLIGALPQGHFSFTWQIQLGLLVGSSLTTEPCSFLQK